MQESAVAYMPVGWCGMGGLLSALSFRVIFVRVRHPDPWILLSLSRVVLETWGWALENKLVGLKRGCHSWGKKESLPPRPFVRPGKTMMSRPGICGREGGGE